MRVQVSDLIATLDKAAARAVAADKRIAELREQLADAKNAAKKERAERLQAAKPIDNDPDSPANKRKAARNEYQRELMRKRRAESRAKTSPAASG